MSYTQMSKRIIMVLKNKVVREALKKMYQNFLYEGGGVAGGLAGSANGAKQTKTYNESSLMYYTTAGRRESD